MSFIRFIGPDNTPLLIERSAIIGIEHAGEQRAWLLLSSGQQRLVFEPSIDIARRIAVEDAKGDMGL